MKGLYERWESVEAVSKREKLAANQWDWIERTLRTSTAEWLFVVGHYPVYTGGEHGDTDALVKVTASPTTAFHASYANIIGLCVLKKLLPMMDSYQVDAYICGHVTAFRVDVIVGVAGN